MSDSNSLVGKIFGKLEVLSEAEPIRYKCGLLCARSVCKCECGKTIVTQNRYLKRAGKTSCGCSNRKTGPPTRHGHASFNAPSSTYQIWANMLQRCYNSKLPNYKDYGGRGIKVCDRWKSSFESFLVDMGERPIGKSLDRFPNNDGDYEPHNCRWATRSEQARNTRQNHVLTVRGKTGCIADLCEQFEIDHELVRARLKRGWEIEMAFFQTSQPK